MRALKKNNKNINDNEPFRGLFTQGMVCHETYKDQNGKWLNPTEVEKSSKGEAIKIKDKSIVKVGPSESMSKSKKNVIDPEQMITSYGADAVRWFILSDSPPRKIFNGQIKVLMLHINFCKKFIIYAVLSKTEKK